MALARNAIAREIIGETESFGQNIIRNSAEELVGNLNNNAAKGNFGVYEIVQDSNVFKFGKADLNRVTQSSGLPTRIHQQVRMLRELNPGSEISARVVKRMAGSTTREAKAAETAVLRNYYSNKGRIPPSNVLSFRP